MIFESALKWNNKRIEVTPRFIIASGKRARNINESCFSKGLLFKVVLKTSYCSEMGVQALSNSEVSCDGLTGFIYDSCF